MEHVRVKLNLLLTESEYNECYMSCEFEEALEDRDLQQVKELRKIAEIIEKRC